jgi:hypothetical protein
VAQEKSKTMERYLQKSRPKTKKKLDMNIQEGIDGGIYEPIRKKICGDGPCEGEKLALYRDILGVIKLVEDNIAETCFNMGVENERKRIISVLVPHLSQSHLKESIDEIVSIIKCKNEKRD